MQGQQKSASIRTLRQRQAAHFTPLYADIWLHRSSPPSAINDALEEALDDATVWASTEGKTAKTNVWIRAMDAALVFGEPK
jgi:hypothetical protein